MIRITSKQAGFRRCDIAHPATPTEYPDGHFSAGALNILQHEPMLTVELIQESPTGKNLNATQTIELVNAAATLDELDKLAEGESRKGVLDAITKRRAALTAPSEPSEPSEKSNQSEGAGETAPVEQTEEHV